MRNSNQTLLLLFLIASIVSTNLHYTDNATFIQNYPEPDWITVSDIYATWIGMTFMGILGTQGQFWISYFCLTLYSFTGLSSPAHYFYGALSDFSIKMHALIWLDLLTGAFVLSFVVWSGFILREWQPEE
ncbi:MAG: hypothetical protein AB4368_26335 [Xenococcaceae cyanobacterium]